MNTYFILQFQFKFEKYIQHVFSIKIQKSHSN
nr:MAG TPA: hypothetical protein [Caudoviricetes sp.]